MCFSPDAILYSFMDMLRYPLQDSYQQDCWLMYKTSEAVYLLRIVLYGYGAIVYRSQCILASRVELMLSSL